jgi:autotransporter-associated beta strand protein
LRRLVRVTGLASDGKVGAGNGALQAFSAATFSGAVTLVTNASIGGTASNTISGIISGPGLLTKLGTGTQVLTASNTYTGGTLISAGTLQLGNGGTNGWIGPIPAGLSSITNNGVLAFNHSDTVALTNAITGGTNGWINQLGSGTLILGASNNFAGGNVFAHPTIGLNFTAAVYVGAGTVLVTNSYALGMVGAETSSHLQLAGNISIPAPLSVYSSALGVIDVENVGGTNSVDQFLGIYGNNYWPITASAGQLNINIFSNVVFNSTYGRTLELQGSANGSITNTIDPRYSYLQIQKDGSGTWLLENSIEAPLGLVVNAGTLILDGNLSALLRNQNISHTVAGGTLIVNGSLPVGTTSGNVAVNSGQIGGFGTIGGNVTVASGAAVSPSARNGTNTSLLTINGGLTLAGNLTISLNKSLAQSNDVISVGSTATNSGTGLVTLTNTGSALAVGNTFVIFNQAPIGGGGNLRLNSVVRGVTAQYVTWTNNLGVDGSISVLSVAPLGTNSTLLSLALNPTDNLTPNFATNVFVYAATNTLGVNPTITVTNADFTASNALVVNGVFSQVLTSGVPSLAITSLGIGSTNVLKVFVTAQDTVTTNLYSINLTQLASSVNTNSFAINSSVSGGNLNLNWPPDRLGWRLWVQTNSLNTGLGNNWSVWPNSTTVTNVSVPINPANPSVFFRLTYP